MATRSLNKVMLIGNLGKDPELRYTQSSIPVASFSIATSESWTDKEGNQQEQTEWHRIVIWRGLAEVCGKYLTKGSRVYIEGKLQTRSWEDQNGVTKYTTEIVANQMLMLGGPGERSDSGSFGPPPPEEPPAYQQKNETPSSTAHAGTEDDIPF